MVAGRVLVRPIEPPAILVVAWRLRLIMSSTTTAPGHVVYHPLPFLFDVLSSCRLRNNTRLCELKQTIPA